MGVGRELWDHLSQSRNFSLWEACAGDVVYRGRRRPAWRATCNGRLQQAISKRSSELTIGGHVFGGGWQW